MSSLTAEVDGEELSWVQSNVDEVIAMLQQCPGLPSVPEVSEFVCFFVFSLKEPNPRKLINGMNQ